MSMVTATVSMDMIISISHIRIPTGEAALEHAVKIGLGTDQYELIEV